MTYKVCQRCKCHFRAWFSVKIKYHNPERKRSSTARKDIFCQYCMDELGNRLLDFLEEFPNR